MADTPRVTVPVEPTPEMIAAAAGLGLSMIAADNTPGCVKIYRAMLSAAPAPEGGEVTAAASALLDACIADFGDPKDFPDDDGWVASGDKGDSVVTFKHMRDLQSALATRELLSDPQQLEAPAEAAPCPFCGCRMRVSYDSEREMYGPDGDHLPGCIIGNWDLHEYAFRPDALAAWNSRSVRAQPPAREEDGGTLDPAFVAWLKERDCLPNDDDGTIEWADIICALNDWEADLTPAREDAQPEAVKALVDAALTYIAGKGHAPGFGPLGKLHEAAWAVKRSPLYTHPAPDARVAVEAVLSIKDAADSFRDCSGDEVAGQVIIRCDQALDALQAEQGAK
ncbi:hypothetical protein ACWQV9_09905 [Brevundimonas diminuta]